MGDRGVRVRTATPADLPVLASLARATFVETYAQDNDPEDTSDYVASAFHDDRLRAELADLQTQVLLAMVGDEPVGYATVVLGSEPSGLDCASPAELARIYVLGRHQGRGVGRVLLEASLDRARAGGAEALWLGVWERNIKAIGFYERMGFDCIGTHEFRLGSEVQTDVVMAIRLG